MSGKADFTDEEWARLKRAPFVAGMAISFADPGGPIELAKETAATLKVVTHTAQQLNRGELVDALATEAITDARARHNPLHDYKPKAVQEIVDELAAVSGIVSAKASPEDADAFRAWLNDAAREAADAAKEGGFMGFHSVRVSEGEQRMLDKLAEVLAAPA